MKTRVKKITTAGLAAGAVVAPQVQAERINAWSAPQWGFVQKIKKESVAAETKDSSLNSSLPRPSSSSLSKSLIFDQGFDRQSYRPWQGLSDRAVVKNTRNDHTLRSAPLSTFNNRDASEPFIKAAGIDAALKSIEAHRKAGLIENLGTFSKQTLDVRHEALSNIEHPHHSEELQLATEGIPVSKLSEKKLASIIDAQPELKWTTEQSRALEKKLENAELTLFGGIPLTAPSAQMPSQSNTSEAPKTTKDANKSDVATKKSALQNTANNSTSETPKNDAKNSEGADIANARGVQLSKLVIPRADARIASLYLVDDESLSTQQALGVANAEVIWIGPHSGLSSISGKGGTVRAPYVSTHSMRFFVKAPGYLPAVGYASAGLVTPVTLVKESRLGPVITSLGVVPDASRVMVFGKILDAHGKPSAGVSVDVSIENPFRVFYSLGSFGVFHRQANSTGPTGEFFVSGTQAGLQYFMPTQSLTQQPNYSVPGSALNVKSVEWPASILNLSGVGPVVSLTIQQSELRNLRTQVVDAFLMERPSDVGIQLTIGGQRGVLIPDNDGYIQMSDIYRRSTPDLVEVRAQGYLKTWVTGSPEKGAFPETVALFTQRQVDTLLAEALSDIQLSKGIVFGNLRAESFKNSVQIRVYDSHGRKASNAKVLYFDDKNLARLKLDRTDSIVQNFAVANLEPGEWQLVAIDARTGKAAAAEVVRVEFNTISQVQF